MAASPGRQPGSRRRNRSVVTANHPSHDMTADQSSKRKRDEENVNFYLEHIRTLVELLPKRSRCGELMASNLPTDEVADSNLGEGSIGNAECADVNPGEEWTVNQPAPRQGNALNVPRESSSLSLLLGCNLINEAEQLMDVKTEWDESIARRGDDRLARKQLQQLAGLLGEEGKIMYNRLQNNIHHRSSYICKKYGIAKKSAKKQIWEMTLEECNQCLEELRRATCYVTAPEQELMALKQDTESLLQWISNIHSRYTNGETLSGEYIDNLIKALDSKNVARLIGSGDERSCPITWVRNLYAYILKIVESMRSEHITVETAKNVLQQLSEKRIFIHPIEERCRAIISMQPGARPEGSPKTGPSALQIESSVAFQVATHIKRQADEDRRKEKQQLRAGGTRRRRSRILRKEKPCEPAEVMSPKPEPTPGKSDVGDRQPSFAQSVRDFCVLL